MDLQEVGWGMVWIAVAQDRHRWRAVMIKVMDFQFA
jgi:hypothetical protein